MRSVSEYMICIINNIGQISQRNQFNDTSKKIVDAAICSSQKLVGVVDEDYALDKEDEDKLRA